MGKVIVGTILLTSATPNLKYFAQSLGGGKQFFFFWSFAAILCYVVLKELQYCAHNSSCRTGGMILSAILQHFLHFLLTALELCVCVCERERERDLCCWPSLHPVSRLASAAGPSLSGRSRNVASPALHYYYSNCRKKLSSGLHIFYLSALECCHALTSTHLKKRKKSCICSYRFYFIFPITWR